MKQTVEKVRLPVPLTLEDLVPDWNEPLQHTILAKLYAGGTRLDNGWQFRWDGITRRVPSAIPMKHRGRKLQSMTVLCDTHDRKTIQTILAYYTWNECIEYSFEYGGGKSNVSQ